MKALDILSSLSPTETKELDEIIAKHKRAGIKKLYTALKKYRSGKKDPDKEHLFKETFGKAYTKDQDYLLRNELRILGEITKDLMVNKGLEFALKHNEHLRNYWYLRGLADRKLYDLFDVEYQKTYPKAQEDNQLHICIEMARSNIFRMKEQGWMRDKKISSQDVLDQLRLLLKHLEDHAAVNLNYINYQEALLIRKARSLGSEQFLVDQKEYVPHDTIKIEFDKLENPLAKLYHIFSKTYLEPSPQKRKELILEALTYLEDCKDIPSNGYNCYTLLATCYNLLSLASVELEDPESEALYAGKCLEAVVQAGTNTDMVLANYLRALIKAQQWDKIHETLVQYAEQLVNVSNIPVLHSALIEAYIFLDKLDDAMLELREFKTNETINYISYKMMLMIIYIKKEELSLALNEVDNLIKFLNKNKEGDLTPLMISLTKATREWLKAHIIDPGTKKTINKSINYLDQIKPEQMKFITRSSLFSWLVDNNKK